ncbi:MAG: hypothetical protein AB7O50_12435 [Pseudolabrys sp.]
MIRKLIIIAGAAATLAAASLAPTAASAAGGWHGWHGHHGHHRHWRGHYGPSFGFYAPAYYGYGCYVVKKRVFTPYGPRIRRVTVCN